MGNVKSEHVESKITVVKAHLIVMAVVFLQNVESNVMFLFVRYSNNT